MGFRRLAPVTAATCAAGLAGGLALACHHGADGTTLPAAGSAQDDGSGLLARASVKFYTSSDEGGFEPSPSPQPVNTDYGYNGFTYGGFGGDAYGGFGGSTYAAYQPYAPYTPPNRTPPYAISYATDGGSIAGAVSWPKAPKLPASLPGPSGCDSIENQSVRLGPGNTVEGAIVYLDKITSGRTFLFVPKPISTGGTIEVSGCAVVPSVQIFGPAPGALTVSNSQGLPETLVIGPPGNATATTEVKLENGRTQVLPINAAGLLEVTDKAGALPPAWLMIAPHPYYTLTDDHGRFRLDDVVPGDYDLVVWQAPPITGVTNGVVQVGAPVVMHKKVTVKKLAETRADVVLP